MHLIEDGLPSVEGLLVRNGRASTCSPCRRCIQPREQILRSSTSRFLVVPRERVAFYEVLA
jgi:hypothetical protein